MRAVTAAAVLLPSIGGVTQTTKPYVFAPEWRGTRNTDGANAANA
jgi:hypothetical protein